MGRSVRSRDPDDRDDVVGSGGAGVGRAGVGRAGVGRAGVGKADVDRTWYMRPGSERAGFEGPDQQGRAGTSASERYGDERLEFDVAADDVADVDTMPRRGPRWRLWLTVAAVAVAGFLMYLRLTGSDVSVDAEAPGFPRPYTVELLVSVTNRGGEPMDVVPLAGDQPGLVYRGAFDPAEGSSRAASMPVHLPPQGQTTFALRWQVEDCGQVVANTGPVDVRVQAGPPIGIREIVPVRAGQWAEFVPQVCRTRPDRGVPLLAGQEVQVHDGRVFAEITILNAGGRALQLRSAGLPAGWRQLTTGGRDRELTIAVGRQEIVWYAFQTHDCQVPEDGPAELDLRFDSVGTGRTEVLPVTLADSWANLLGACSKG
jgi:hypothetical protein